MIKPLKSRVLILPDTPEKQIGKILLPDNAKKESQSGKVIAIGDDVVEVKKGDVVYFARYAGSQFKHEGKDLLLVEVEDLLGVLQ